MLQDWSSGREPHELDARWGLPGGGTWHRVGGTGGGVVSGPSRAVALSGRGPVPLHPTASAPGHGVPSGAWSR